MFMKGSISMNKKIDDILTSLAKSNFRSRFHLTDRDVSYIDEHGLDMIEHHARDFLTTRIRKRLPNDGKQTPMKGHPVFIAQHATATCCRGCINKWYALPLARDLNDEEIDFLTSIIMCWIKTNYNSIKNEAVTDLKNR